MYICGRNVAKEYLNNKSEIKNIYLSHSFSDNEIVNIIKKRHLKVIYTSKQDLDKLTVENHQGIVLEVGEYEYTSLDYLLNQENPLVVMLDHLNDPHNFGAIIRTCEAAGVDFIIIPKDRSVSVNETVIRTSVGACKYMKIVRVTNLYQTIEKMKQAGFWFFGTDMNGSDYSKLDYKGKCCLVIGSEGEGMSKLVKDNCDFIASIPMKGKINSLNASVAAGIIIYKASEVRNEV